MKINENSEEEISENEVVEDQYILLRNSTTLQRSLSARMFGPMTEGSLRGGTITMTGDNEHN